MNVQSLPMTKAEEALLAAAASLPASVVSDAAAQRLRLHGLPTRRVEAWHYTNLRTELRSFDGLAETPSKEAVAAWLKHRTSIVPAVALPFLDGVFLEEHADAPPAGVTVSANDAAPEFDGAQDATGLINALLSRRGARIEVAAGTGLSRPVAIEHGMTDSGASALTHAVTIGAKASANFIEHQRSPNGVAAFSSAVTNLALAAGAKAVWTIVQEQGDGATHLASLNVTLDADSDLTILVLNTGGALVRQEIAITVSGEPANLAIRGVNLIGGERHLDVATVISHDAPHGVSTELFRNVVTDKASGAFQGLIRVAQPAQKTDARMACNTLLLSDNAEFSAKPELEIFADDVQCGHGATVSDIDADQLFYLRARGIPENQARAMLIEAFVAQVFAEVADEALRDALNGRISAWLEAHG